MNTAVACVHKCFTLTAVWNLASANVCEAAPNTQLKQLLAGEKSIFILKEKSSNLYIIMFYVSENVSEYIFMHSALICVRKCFILTGGLKSGKCERLWSSAEHTAEAVTCQGKYIYPTANIVKSLHNYVRSQWKLLWVCIYAHCSSMRSQMLYTRGSFEICQERLFVKQRRKHRWSSNLLVALTELRKKLLCTLYHEKHAKF